MTDGRRLGRIFGRYTEDKLEEYFYQKNFSQNANLILFLSLIFVVKIFSQDIQNQIPMSIFFAICEFFRKSLSRENWPSLPFVHAEEK